MTSAIIYYYNSIEWKLFTSVTGYVITIEGDHFERTRTGTSLNILYVWQWSIKGDFTLFLPKFKNTSDLSMSSIGHLKMYYGNISLQWCFWTLYVKFKDFSLFYTFILYLIWLKRFTQSKYGQNPKLKICRISCSVSLFYRSNFNYQTI